MVKIGPKVVSDGAVRQVVNWCRGCRLKNRLFQKILSLVDATTKTALDSPA